MKLKTLLQIIFIMCLSKSIAQIVNIPDANFRNALLNHDPVIDTNEDGEIQVSEANDFSGILDVSNSSISDLTGIEEFTGILILNFQNNVISTVDLSASTFLQYLYGQDNNLITMDLSQNTLLFQVYLSNNNLNNLLLPNGSMSILEIENNNLSSLDITGLGNLNTLIVNYNNLTNLNVSENTNLIGLFFEGNQIASVDTNNNSLLKFINGRGNGLASLNFTNNTALEQVYMDDNELTVLNLSNNSQLNNIFLGENQLTNLDLSENPLLIDIFVNQNTLESLNIQNGNNGDIFNLITTGNPALECIQVDMGIPGNIPGNWGVDPWTTFSEDCMYLGINENSPLFAISVYPNPATSQLTIEIEGNIEIKKIYINNVLGQLFDAKIQGNNLDVTALKAGLYFITMETTEGSVVQKFIKE